MPLFVVFIVFSVWFERPALHHADFTRGACAAQATFGFVPAEERTIAIPAASPQGNGQSARKGFASIGNHATDAVLSSSPFRDETFMSSTIMLNTATACAQREDPANHHYWRDLVSLGYGHCVSKTSTAVATTVDQF